MRLASHAGKWPVLAFIFFLLTYVLLQIDFDLLFEKDFHLPRPIVDWRRINARNTYALASGPARDTSTNSHADAHAMSMTFIVRTYQKFLASKSTENLLHDLDKQVFAKEAARFPVSAVVVATDADSLAPVRSAVRGTWKDSGVFKHVGVHFHEIPFEVYVDNCCQSTEMCDGRLREKFEVVANKDSVFGKYREPSEKIKTVCAGNNLLHYVLTDAALKYVLNSCTADCDQKLVIATNGDNSYAPSFAERVMHEFQKNPTVDAVMVDYMERGALRVKVGLTGNSMDLGAMVFRVSSLQRLALATPTLTQADGADGADGAGSGELAPAGQNIGFLAPLALLKNAWPHDYYAADNRFMTYLVHKRGAKVALVEETLFTHW